MFTAFLLTVSQFIGYETIKQFRYFMATEMCLNAVAPCNFNVVSDTFDSPAITAIK